MRGVSVILTAIQDEDMRLLKECFHIDRGDVRYECHSPDFGLGWEWVCSRTIQRKEWLWDWGLEARTDEDRLLHFASGLGTRSHQQGAQRAHGLALFASVRGLHNHEHNDLRRARRAGEHRIPNLCESDARALREAFSRW